MAAEEIGDGSLLNSITTARVACAVVLVYTHTVRSKVSSHVWLTFTYVKMQLLAPVQVRGGEKENGVTSKREMNGKRRREGILAHAYSVQA